jgi:hypothetical protein
MYAFGQLKTNSWNYIQSKPGTRIKKTKSRIQHDLERNIAFYKDNFVGQRITKLNIAHLNYVALESSLGPLVVSLIKTCDKYKVVIRSRDGQGSFEIDKSKVGNSWKTKLLSREPSLEQILTAMGCSLPLQDFVVCLDANLPNDLIKLEESFLLKGFSFAIVKFGGIELDVFSSWLLDTIVCTADTFTINWQGFLISGEFVELDDLENVTSDILLAFQSTPTKGLIQKLEQTGRSAFGLLTMEKELDGSSLEFAVRQNLDMQTLKLPQPAIIHYDQDSRNFLLSIRTV